VKFAFPTSMPWNWAWVFPQLRTHDRGSDSKGPVSSIIHIMTNKSWLDLRFTS
jgi:hypothetical protein